MLQPTSLPASLLRRNSGLLSNATNRLAAIDTIESVLNSLSGYEFQGADWSPDYYADLAIKASLRSSKPGQATAILLRGLQLDPYSDQLQYLARIFAREGLLQSADTTVTEVRAFH